MKKAGLIVTVLVLCLLSGCKEPSEETYEVNIDIEQAERIAYETLAGDDSESLFMCETIRVIDGEIYYLIRGFCNSEDKVTTFGWYLLNAQTGELFDTSPAQNERIPIDTKNP